MTVSVHVRVPASSTNLGAGFDCVGVAVSRWLDVSVAIDAAAWTLIVERTGTLAGLLVAPADDRIVTGFNAACEAAGRRPPSGLHIHAHSTIPVARGLGSSAAAVVAGAAAANELFGLALTDRDILRVAAGVEGHPDNAAAALFGGAVLAASAGGELCVVPLSVHESLSLIFAVPPFPLETTEARRRLPANVPHREATRAAGLAAALVHGLATANRELLAAALEEDVLHVPYRRSLIAGYDDVAGAARAAGAVGTTLSGSGSTLVAIASRTLAPAVAEAMRAAWSSAGVAVETLINPSRVKGYSALVTPPGGTPSWPSHSISRQSSPNSPTGV